MIMIMIMKMKMIMTFTFFVFQLIDEKEFLFQENRISSGERESKYY